MQSFFTTRYNRTHGFSLLELAVVLMIVSILLAGTLSVFAQKNRAEKERQLQAKMDVIEAALKSFRIINDRLPCPTDGTALIDSADFGWEGPNGQGNCAADNPQANFILSGQAAMGVLPVRAMGLSDEFMFDPWGGKFTYVVDVRMTQTLFGTRYPPSSNTLGDINILTPASSGIVDTKVIAVLISHGPNGHGAYQLSGQRKIAAAGLSSGGEAHNCQCDANGSLDETGAFAREWSAGTSSNYYFDDIVRVYKRSDFLNDAERATVKLPSY